MGRQAFSDREGLSAIQLFQIFPDEASCRSWFEEIRWPDGGRHCPHCGSLKTSPVRSEKPMPYHCGECRQYFSVKTGTVMQSSKVSLQKWLVAMYLLSASSKGVSRRTMHRDLGVTQKTAWMLAQKIQLGWIRGSDKRAEAEVNAGHSGGKERNKGASERRRTVKGARLRRVIQRRSEALGLKTSSRTPPS